MKKMRKEQSKKKLRQKRFEKFQKSDFHEIMKKLKFLANPDSLDGMTRFGINIDKCYGISIPDLRSMAKTIGRDHILAQKLWQTGIHDARLLATMVDKPELVDEKQMERWVNDFNSWDICDQCCSNLFSYSPLAWQKAVEWTVSRQEYVKRAGFVLMATLAVHDKETPDKDFINFFPLLLRESYDERNFVKKAINWALRQIGKRNQNLNKEAIVAAKDIAELPYPSAKWIASNALSELNNPDIKRRLKH